MAGSDKCAASSKQQAASSKQQAAGGRRAAAGPMANGCQLGLRAWATGRTRSIDLCLHISNTLLVQDDPNAVNGGLGEVPDFQHDRLHGFGANVLVGGAGGLHRRPVRGKDSRGDTPVTRAPSWRGRTPICLSTGSLTSSHEVFAVPTRTFSFDQVSSATVPCDRSATAQVAQQVFFLRPVVRL